MSYTYDGVRAEVEYRRGQLLAGARGVRASRRSRRRLTRLDASTREQVRDGTDARGYDLAA